MRKIYSILFVMLAVCGVVNAQVVFDATETLGNNTAATGEDEVSLGGITISTTDGGLGTGSQYRFAKSSTTTFTSTVGNITSIVFTCTADGTTKYGPGCFDAQDGYSYEGKVGTWSGNATTVVFVAGTAQVRATKIEVYLDGETPQPVDPTPTPSIDWTSSADVPLTVAALMEKAAQLEPAAESNVEVYVKGLISQIDEVSPTYGNATYYISDDGNTAGQFEIYRGLGLGGEKFTSEDDLEEGDEVIVVGVVKNFVTSDGASIYEFKQGSKIHSLNGQTADVPTPQPPTGESKGDGSLDNPFNAVAAIAAASALASGQTSSESYYIYGKISQITYNFDTEHETATFFISEDGTEDGQFQAYGVYYLGNRRFAEGDTQIALGDDVIIYGQLTNYKGNTPETANKKAFLYSLNGVTDGGQEPQPVELVGDGSLANPFTVADVQAVIANAPADKVWVRGYIVASADGSLNKLIFESGEAAVNTNIMLAASADEEDSANMIPVQLPKGDVRDLLNIHDNAEYLGKLVWIHGTVEKYFSVPGVKNVDNFNFDGTDAIRDLRTVSGSQTIFNLAGQRMTQAGKPGLYIIGGQKVVVK